MRYYCKIPYRSIDYKVSKTKVSLLRHSYKSIYYIYRDEKVQYKEEKLSEEAKYREEIEKLKTENEMLVKEAK